MAQKTWRSAEGFPSAASPEVQQPPDQPVDSAEKARRLPKRTSRRRPAAIAVAVALAILGGLVAWSAYQSSGASPYLVINQQVQRGDQITQAMLGSIDIVGDPGSLIAADNAASVIGKVATMDLADGTAVTTDNTGETLGVPEGASVIGLALEAGNLPSRPLRAGDTVLIVETPAVGQAPPQAEGGSEIRTVAGTVESTDVDEISGRTVVDVLVPAGEAPQVATWGASGTASLALQSDQTGQEDDG